MYFKWLRVILKVRVRVRLGFCIVFNIFWLLSSLNPFILCFFFSVAKDKLEGWVG